MHAAADAGGGGGYTNDGLIDPSLFPCKSTDFSEQAILDSAAAVAGMGENVLSHTETVNTEWSGLQGAGVYEAPEQDAVYALMQPAVQDATEYRDSMSRVSSALTTYAGELAAVQADLSDLEDRAMEFRAEALRGYEVSNIEANGWMAYAGYADMGPAYAAQVAGTDADPMGTTVVSWKEHEPAVEKNEALLREYAEILERISTAAVTCANAINAELDVCPAEAPTQITADDIMNSSDPMPWGSAVTEDRNCTESVGHGLGNFWHNTWTGAASLIGRDPTTGEWSLGTAGQAWWGMGDFVVSTAVVLSPGALVSTVRTATGNGTAVDDWVTDRVNTAATAWGSLIGYDHQATLAGENGWHAWEEDGVAAATESVANIGTFFIPVAGWAGGATRAGSVGARLGTLTGRTVTTVADFAVPGGSWLARGGIRAGELLTGGFRTSVRGIDGLDAAPTRPGGPTPAPGLINALTDGPTAPGAPGSTPDLTPGGTGTPWSNPAGSSAPTLPDHTPVSQDLGLQPSTAHDTAPAETHGHAPSADDGTAGQTDAPDATEGTKPSELPAPARSFDPESPVRETIPAREAPTRYTAEDVQRALDEAPRNEHGHPVDHRDGMPLRGETSAGSRGWEMRWDVEGGRWVAENRGGPSTGAWRPDADPWVSEGRPGGAIAEPGNPTGLTFEAARTADPSLTPARFGEQQAQAYMEANGYMRVDDGSKSPNAPGIDMVLRHDDGHFVVVEAKYGTSRLGTLSDGTPQMSDRWLTGPFSSRSGDTRVEAAMHEDLLLAEDLADAYSGREVTTVVVNVGTDGTAVPRLVDSNGTILNAPPAL